MSLKDDWNGRPPQQFSRSKFTARRPPRAPRLESEFYYRIKEDSRQSPANPADAAPTSRNDFYWNEQMLEERVGPPRRGNNNFGSSQHNQGHAKAHGHGHGHSHKLSQTSKAFHVHSEHRGKRTEAPPAVEKCFPDDCLICLEGVPTRSRVWVCRQCAVLTHLPCINNWAAKQHTNAKSDETRNGFSCPHCNFFYVGEEPVPSCFCGKEVRPDHSQFHAPNSCGRVCGKKLSAVCPHTCEAVCHSGNCPPCIRKTIFRCFCDKTEREISCSELLNPKALSCGHACGRLLNCGVHRCAETCHDGKCPHCGHSALVPCFCGQESRTLKCSEHFSCGNMCGKLLACGNHRCPKPCHEGPCEPCPAPIKEHERCFCGESAVADLLGAPRASCATPRPSCHEPCNKLLPCFHNCVLDCHSGPHDCGRTVQAKCRCDSHTFAIHCSEKASPILCKTVCGKKLSCGKHFCERVCCPHRNKRKEDPGHTCQQTCNAELACGKHDCLKKCHKGPCPPCDAMLSRPLTCACLKEVLLPPLLCGTEPPKCHRRCNKRMGCGHPCYFDCHFGECLPCEETVNKRCLCGAQEMKQVKCSQSARCGRVCDALLDCGHRCLALCHEPGTCHEQRANLRKRFPTDASIAAADKELILDSGLLEATCLARCNKPRAACGHSCQAYCHPGVACPDRECKVMVSVACPCGLKQEFAECRVAVTGDKPPLACDAKCLNQQRFKALFELEAEDCRLYFSEFLVKFGRENPRFLAKLEKDLREGFLNAQSKFSATIEKGAVDKLQFVLSLLSVHYRLEVSFLKTEKTAFVDAQWGPKSILPKVPLSGYLEKMRRREIAKDHLPFEAVLKFYNLSVFDKPERLEEEFASAKDRFYLEKSGSALFMFLWKKDDVEFFADLLRKLNGNWTNFVVTVKKTPELPLEAAPALTNSSAPLVNN